MNTNWYRNLSIRGKLIAGFGTLMMLLVIVLGTAEFSLRSVYNNAYELGFERYPKADSANDLIKLAQLAANSYRDLALSVNPVENAEDRKIIRDSREGIDQNLRRLERLASTKEETELIDDIKHKLVKLNDQFDVFFKLLESDREQLLTFIPQSIAPVTDSFIASLQAMEDMQAKKVTETAATALDVFRTSELYTGVIGAISLVLAALMSYYISRGISSSLKLSAETLNAFVAGWEEKADIAEAIAAGDLDRKLGIGTPVSFDEGLLSRDESGELLRTVAALSRVQVSFDTALVDMNHALRSKRDEETLRDWIKTGEGQLNALLRGDQSAFDVAEKTLTFLADYLKAGVGAFYLIDGEGAELRLAASYAFTRRKNLGESFHVGEGLIGQAAKEGKQICWTQVPADYLHIGSALGEAAPRNAVATPIRREGRLLGIIELGTFKELSDNELSFLSQSADAIAIGLGVAEARQRVNELLEETRSQADKLQAQQDQLQQSNEELEERARLLELQKRQVDAKNLEIETVSAEIQRKAQELERISTYKSEFLANMSHELRTPLNSMMILSRLLMENKEATLNDKQKEFAATIHTAGKDLLNLINDILDLSKVEAGQMQFHFEDVELAALAKSVESLFGPQAEHKGLAFSVKLAAEAPAELHTDEQRVQQILKNLLSNALKFTSEGSVTLDISMQQAAQSPLRAPAVVFAVKDSGLGIPLEKQALVFEAFQQADGTTSRKFGGTGLGLSIARQLARHMGGDILLESTEGHGSVFSLVLPVAGVAPGTADKDHRGEAPPAMPADTARHAAPVAPPAPAPRAGDSLPATVVEDDRAIASDGGRSILVIEDDLAFAKILRDMVRDKGFLALVATDGESGIQLAETCLPSAIILDVMLPGIDGWGVMRHLKEQAATRHIPVHFVTCLEDRKRALSMGATGLVTKPVSPEQMDEVFAALEHIIDKSVGRLLIVEDDANELNAMVNLLTERDVAISVARTGAEAIKLIGAESFDCVVLDLGLSDMSGFELLEHLQTQDEERRPPVIVHTGRALTREEETRLHRYAKSVIIKGAQSPERLLNEVSLFLHMVESRLPPEKRRMIRVALDKEAMLEGKKVLVADDDMRNVFSLASLLAGKAMQVVEAENGREALARLDEHPDIDIVLMDIMMPEMDGYEAMAAIRKDERFHDIPIIAMTAKALKGDQEKCIAAGADDYISKPLDVDKLFSLLRVWLYERTLTR